jgi:hypothetical protein
MSLLLRNPGERMDDKCNARVLYRRWVVWLLIKKCTMKIPKETVGRPTGAGYEADVARDSRAADAEDSYGASTALVPDDSSKGDAPDADGDEETPDSAVARPDAGAGSPICCDST